MKINQNNKNKMQNPEKKVISLSGLVKHLQDMQVLYTCHRNRPYDVFGVSPNPLIII